MDEEWTSSMDALSEVLGIDTRPLFDDAMELPRMETFEEVDWMLDPLLADWILLRTESFGRIGFDRAVAMQEYGDGIVRETIMSPVKTRNRIIWGQLLCRVNTGGSSTIVTSGRVTIDCRGQLPTVYKSCEVDADTIQVETITPDWSGNLSGTVCTVPKDNTFTVMTKESWIATKYCDTCSVEDRICTCESNVSTFRNDWTLARIQGGLPRISDDADAWSPALAASSFGLFNGSFVMSMPSMGRSDICRLAGKLAQRRFIFRTCGTMVKELRVNLIKTFLSMTMEYPFAKTMGVARGFEDAQAYLLGYSDGRANPAGVDPPPNAGDRACPYCDAVFKRKYEMTRHVRTVHFNERKHECNICRKKFIHEGHLRVHRNSVHNGESEAACSACGKMFATKAKANRHFQAVHEKQKKHQCEACGKSFFQRSDLKKHHKTHTQENLQLSVRELSISN